MPEDHMDKLYNSKNPLVRFVHNNRLNYIINVTPNDDGLKILDAGCGEGHLIEKLFHKKNKNFYYGTDISETALRKAKQRCPFAEFKLINLSEMDFENNFFDVIICTETIEHILNYGEALKNLKRILKNDGYLIITFPNEILWTISRFFLGRKPIKVPDHVNSFTPNKIKSILKMKFVSQRNMPFKLPFFISLGCLLKFKKE